ncbi:LCP family protein [Actinocorallia aurantiaca]|uniref:Cell envelope-related transcriptional attenuator domain-containing protein n=1 Tax=Actinocorallia aurantiaca TaxID=46204 RepID=A0ABN3TTN4_9ACTN
MKRTLLITLAAAVVWGTAHFRTGRRIAGALLLALELMFLVGAVLLAWPLREELASWLVQPFWLDAATAALIFLGMVWCAVIIRSYQLVAEGNGVAVAGVVVLCALVVAPLAYGVELVRVSKNLVTDVFAEEDGNDAPFGGRDRLNVLLLGADAGPNRVGVRTDSMTVASIDVRRGETTLFSLPRNLEKVPMPTAVSREAFPDGFAGTGDATTPGLLNEVFQWAEEHPEIVPGVAKGDRGPTLLKQTVGGILGLTVDYYVMVDMKGFAELVDAVGGIRINVTEELVYGRQSEGRIPAGLRTLTGEQALWFGRTRTNSDDYHRMSRQKCLLYALSQQADPGTLLTRFHGIASATKRAVSTDLPQNVLPEVIDLSRRFKGSDIKSVQFVPPLISTANPDWELIRSKVVTALATPAAKAKATRPASVPPTPVARPAAAVATPTAPGATPTDGTTPGGEDTESLAKTCA